MTTKTKPTLEQVVRVVADAADREMFTPMGLLDYVRDLENYPEVYGKDIDRERILERLFGDSGVGPDDIDERVCRLAQQRMGGVVVEDEPEEDGGVFRFGD